MKFKRNKIVSLLMSSCLFFSNQSHAQNEDQALDHLHQQMQTIENTDHDSENKINYILEKMNFPLTENDGNASNLALETLTQGQFVWLYSADSKPFVEHYLTVLKQLNDPVLSELSKEKLTKILNHQYRILFQKFFNIDETHPLYVTSAGFVNLVNKVTIKQLPETIKSELTKLAELHIIPSTTINKSMIISNMYEAYTDEYLEVYTLYHSIHSHKDYGALGSMDYGSDLALYYHLYLSRYLWPETSELKNSYKYSEIISQYYALNHRDSTKEDFLQNATVLTPMQRKEFEKISFKLANQALNIQSIYEFMQSLPQSFQEYLEYPTVIERNPHPAVNPFGSAGYRLHKARPLNTNSHVFNDRQRQAYRHNMGHVSTVRQESMEKEFSSAWKNSNLLKPFREARERGDLELYKLLYETSDEYRVRIGQSSHPSGSVPRYHNEDHPSYTSFILKAKNSDATSLFVDWTSGHLNFIPFYGSLKDGADVSVHIRNQTHRQILFNLSKETLRDVAKRSNMTAKVKAYLREIPTKQISAMIRADIKSQDEAVMDPGLRTPMAEAIYHLKSFIPFVEMGRCLHNNYLSRQCVTPGGVTMDIASILPSMMAIGRTASTARRLHMAMSTFRRGGQIAEVNLALKALRHSARNAATAIIDDTTIVNLDPVIGSLKHWGKHGNAKLLKTIGDRSYATSAIPDSHRSISFTDLADDIIDKPQVQTGSTVQRTPAMTVTHGRGYRYPLPIATRVQPAPKNPNLITTHAEVHAEPAQLSQPIQVSPEFIQRTPAQSVSRNPNLITTHAEVHVDSIMRPQVTKLPDATPEVMTPPESPQMTISRSRTDEGLNSYVPEQRNLARAESVINESGKLRYATLIDELEKTAAAVVKPRVTRSKTFHSGFDEAGDAVAGPSGRNSGMDYDEFNQLPPSDRPQALVDRINDNSRRTSGDYTDSGYASRRSSTDNPLQDQFSRNLTVSNLKTKALQDAELHNFNIENYRQLSYVHTGPSTPFPGLYTAKQAHGGYAIEMNGHYYRVIRKHAMTDEYWNIHNIETEYRDFFDATDELYLASNKYDRSAIWKVRLDVDGFKVDDRAIEFINAHHMKQGIRYDELPKREAAFTRNHVKDLLNSDDEAHTFLNAAPTEIGANNYFHGVEKHINMDTLQLEQRLEEGTKLASVFEVNVADNISHAQRQFLRSRLTQKHMLKALNENREIIEEDLALDVFREFDARTMALHQQKVAKAGGRDIPNTIRHFKDATDINGKPGKDGRPPKPRSGNKFSTMLKSYGLNKSYKATIHYRANEPLGFSLTKVGDEIQKIDNLYDLTIVLKVDYVVENSVLRPSIKLTTLYPNQR